ncbi:MAG: DUF3130 family protein [Propionibacteriaceae bacterium]|jgi:tmRNA-binding protein|nr:DUF3130 family protein [Propionibacteriaceae bacterium]
MGGGIVLSGDEMESLKQQMTNLATNLAEVSNGAYVSDPDSLFAQSSAKSADQMKSALETLVVCTEAMETLSYAFATYMETIVEGFRVKDIELADHFNIGGGDNPWLLD